MVEVGFGSFPFEGVLRIPLGAVNFRSVELVANGEAGRSDEKMQISFYCHIGRYSNLCLTPSASPYRSKGNIFTHIEYLAQNMAIYIQCVCACVFGGYGGKSHR